MRKLTGLLLMFAFWITLVIPAARVLIADSGSSTSLVCLQDGESEEGPPSNSHDGHDSGSDFFKDPDFYDSPLIRNFGNLAPSYELEPSEDFFALPSGVVLQLRRPPRA